MGAITGVSIDKMIFMSLRVKALLRNMLFECQLKKKYLERLCNFYLQISWKCVFALDPSVAQLKEDYFD